MNYLGAGSKPLLLNVGFDPTVPLSRGGPTPHFPTDSKGTNRESSLADLPCELSTKREFLIEECQRYSQCSH